jgi:hypothetical protein
MLQKQDLHGSVSDPVLDTMNFLNEITVRYPRAISFAPGRPFEGFDGSLGPQALAPRTRRQPARSLCRPGQRAGISLEEEICWAMRSTQSG